MADGCPHGMPSPGSCIDCKNEGPLPEPPRLSRDGWPFSAVYDGTCGGCDHGISEGESIVRMSDGQYRHVGTCEKARHHG